MNASPIFIDDDEDYPPPSSSSISSATSTTSSRKRLATSPPPDDRQAKRQTPGRRRSFSYPRNAEDISEEVVGLKLRGEERLHRPDGSLGEAWINPVRRLKNYKFFDAGTTSEKRKYIGLEKLELIAGLQIAGHGLVRGDDIDDEEEAALDDEVHEDGPTLRYQYHETILNAIREYWIGDGRDDAEMYIRTDHAWYILEEPFDHYRHEFVRFWRPHRLSQAVVDYALKRPNNGVMQFKENLFQLSEEAKIMIGRDLTENDFDTSLPVVWLDLKALRSRDPPLFQSLEGTALVEEILQMSIGQNPSTFVSKRSNRSPPLHFNASTRKTVVSPLVSRITQRYFRKTFDCLGQEAPSPSTLPRIRSKGYHRDKKLADDESDGLSKTDMTKSYYSGLTFEGKSYEVGDFVAILRGAVSKDYPFPPRPVVITGNNLVDSSWFARIRHLYTVFDKRSHETLYWAHVQWMQHGSETDIGELAAPNELFMSYECGDIGLATIKQPIQVHQVSEKFIPPTDLESSVFYCRFTVSNIDGSFSDLSQPPPYKFSTIDFEATAKEGRVCEACLTQKWMQTESEGFFPIPSTPNVNIGNTQFHVNDTVLYISPEDEREFYGDETGAEAPQLVVGLIMKFTVTERVGKSNYCRINRLGYMDELRKHRAAATDILPVIASSPLDERQLYRTRDETDVPIENLIRHCVVHIDPNWKPHGQLDSEPDEFFLTSEASRPRELKMDNLRPVDPRRFPKCKECTPIEKVWSNFRRGFKDTGSGDSTTFSATNTVPQLRGMDLCCGAGGLSFGLEKAGFMTARWGVDIDTDSTRSFRANFPQAQVYAQDLNNCVRQALTPPEKQEPIMSLDPSLESTQLWMPRPEEVEMIVSGSPCPDFSIQNKYKEKAGESKTGLVLSVLSLMDHYRPKFFLIENVPGMLHHEAIDQETGNVISAAMVKIILRTVTTLGYSVRWGLFNSANYGTPQDRVRLIFYGSRVGYRVPNLPIPSHTLEKNSRTLFRRFTGIPTKLTPAYAALPPVSVLASIGDLPSFDWKVNNPVTKLPVRTNINTFVAESPNRPGITGYIKEKAYALLRPMTLYQARMRQGNKDNKVALHFTTTYVEGRSHKAERVMAVSMQPHADHRSIPRELNDWGLSHGLSAAARNLWAPGRYGRLDWQGLFQSAITRIDPTAKQGKVLHPSQRRILSIREAARAQGFPDTFKFKGDAPSIIRQIGNAVPIQLGDAFGRMFRDAVILHQLQKEHDIVWW